MNRGQNFKVLSTLKILYSVFPKFSHVFDFLDKMSAYAQTKKLKIFQMEFLTPSRTRPRFIGVIYRKKSMQKSLKNSKKGTFLGKMYWQKWKGLLVVIRVFKKKPCFLIEGAKLFDENFWKCFLQRPQQIFKKNRLYRGNFYPS